MTKGVRTQVIFVASIVIFLVIASMPVAADNNSMSNAYTRSEGYHPDEYICYPDCSGSVDQYDWWKTYLYPGDEVTFTIYNQGTPSLVYVMLQCYSKTGSAIGSEVQIADHTSGSCGIININSEGYRYIRVRTLEGWGDDGTYYDLTVDIDDTNRDSDGDGYKDSEDDCDYSAGDSYEDQLGCPDADSDGWSDYGDDCPNNYWEHLDTDGDTYCDGEDEFPNDNTQWEDADGDGHGDNSWGNQGDHFPSDSTQWYDNDGDGWGDNADGNNPDHCRFVWGSSDEDRNGCPDTDRDGYSDPDQNALPHPDGTADAFPHDWNEWMDTDRDDYGDNSDDCVSTPGSSAYRLMESITSGAGPLAVEFSIFGEYGAELPDTKYSGLDLEEISFLEGNWSYAFTVGADTNSYLVPYLGCPDADGDGIDDSTDAFINDSTQWSDADGDGFGDNYPHPDWASYDLAYCQTILRNSINSGELTFYPRGFDVFFCTAWGLDNDLVSVQNSNFFTCLDGYTIPISWVNDGEEDCVGGEDEGVTLDTFEFYWNSRYYHYRDYDIGWAIPSATTGDACPLTPGSSTIDRFGCPDSDGDGYSDPDSTWQIVDGADNFIEDSSQHSDRDGDGFGDNISGTDGDSCPDSEGTSNVDRFGCQDTDGDGYSDPDDGWFPHPLGEGDSFAQDPTQWHDRDGDSYGDNPEGMLPDICPDEHGNLSGDTDRGCPDKDGDGVADHLDAFPEEKSQWSDSDSDGYGDNVNGTQPDSCPNAYGTSTEDRFGCPDSDGDGYSDMNGFLSTTLAKSREGDIGSILVLSILPMSLVAILLLTFVVRKKKGRKPVISEEKAWLESEVHSEGQFIDDPLASQTDVQSTPPPIPPGWVEHYDQQGNLYYYNAETQESRWDRPQL